MLYNPDQQKKWGSSCVTQDTRLRLAQHWGLIKLSSRHHISIGLETNIVITCIAVTQYPTPPSHISAINHYQLNNRPTFSLLILTRSSASAAGLNQPAPTMVPSALDKAEKEGEFSHRFSHALSWSYPHHRGLVYRNPPLQLGCSVSQISCTDQSRLDCRQLIQSKGEQSNSSWMEVIGKKSRATATLQGKTEDYLHDNKTIWHRG